MIERRKEERRSMLDRRAAATGRRIRHEMGCFTADKCRRENVSDRRDDERRILHRRIES